MESRTNVRRFVSCLLGAVLLVGGVALTAQDKPARERYTATAINTGALTTDFSTRFQVTIDRWSTADQRATLMDTLKRKGQQAMLDALVKMPRVGFYGINGPMYYAEKSQTPDGVSHITLLIERERTFEEYAYRPRSWDYPFMVINLNVKADGTGDGTMSLATKITSDPDGRFIVFENFDTRLVMLKDVKREDR